MREKKHLALRILIFLLIMTFVVGQADVMSFGEEPGNTLNDFLEITKKITKEDGTASDNYYLGEMINVEYTIKSKEVPLNIPKEIAFVIDLTSSMTGKTSGNSGETRLAALKRVFSDILKKWNIPNTKMCLIGFGPFAETITDLTDATPDKIKNEFISKVDKWNEKIKDERNKNGNSDATLRSGTNLGDGLRAAYYKLLSSGNNNAKKYIITLTDGAPTMRTIDDTSTPYFGKDAVTATSKNPKYYPDNPDGFNVTPYKDYACQVMKYIYSNSQSMSFTNFLIGFGIEKPQAETMNEVAKAGNASSVGDINGDGSNDYFYCPSNGTELEQVFKDIQKSIMDPFDFTQAQLVQKFPEESLEMDTNSLNAIPGKYLDLKNNNDIQVDTNKLSIPLKLTLKLKDGTFNLYTLDPSEVKFTIRFRVIKTGQIDVERISGTFLFHNPVTGEKYIAKTSDEIKTINVKQTVNSIIMPPLIVFGNQKDPANVNAVVNPANGLDTPDKHLQNWSIDDTDNDNVNIFDIEDGTPDDTSAKVILKNAAQGIGKITTESSGYGYGAKDRVKGSGSVISIMPQIKNIEMKVGKSQEVSISSLLPGTLSVEDKNKFNKDVTKIMNNYIYNHKYFSEVDTADSLDGNAYKIYPAGEDNNYIGFDKVAVTSSSKDTTEISIGDGSNSNLSNGVWVIRPEKDSNDEVYYRIFTDGALSGNLTTDQNGKNIYWCKGTYRGANKDIQLWKIDLMEDGNYKITSKISSMCIQKSGSKITLKNYYGDQSQRWRIEKIEDQDNSTITEEKNIQSILKNIEFESDKNGKPIATADSAATVKIAFGSDHTKLLITGKKPTVLNTKKLDDGKVLITANVIYKNIGVPGIEGHISKGTVTFEAVIKDFIDVN